jgi:hypothetical protein
MTSAIVRRSSPKIRCSRRIEAKNTRFRLAADRASALDMRVERLASFKIHDSSIRSAKVIRLSADLPVPLCA